MPFAAENRYTVRELNPFMNANSPLRAGKATLVAGALLLAFAASPLLSEPTDKAAAFVLHPPHTFSVGAFQCWILHDSDMDYAREAFFINAPPADLATALQPYGDKVMTPYAALLVKTPDRLILVDTGMGPSKDPREGHLLQSLAAAGFKPEQIDTLVITHGHLDHIGGTLLPDGAPTFPKARVFVDRREWEFWAQDKPDLSSVDIPEKSRQRWIEIAHTKLLPLRGQLTLTEPNAEIAPGVRLVDAAGHTPGQVLVRLESQGKALLYVSDLVLSPVSLEHPDWHTRYEWNVAASDATKRRLLKQAADEHLLVWAMHFSYPGMGYVVADGDHWKWQKL